MKKTLSIIAALMITIGASAQKNFQLSAKSGDTELDASLDEINVKAQLDVPLFKNDLKLEFGVSDSKLDKMLVSMDMSPADVYMTLETARITKKTDDDVLKAFTANKTKGWGAIAKEMGIKPGSPEFHALKGKAKNKKGKGGGPKKGGAEQGGGGPAKGNGKGKGKNK
ncbi:MAG: hypothetical protein JNM96_02665 [Bacteroidia bacterium]|nr:hypothetical protein [Bacteroidia bacterium]